MTSVIGFKFTNATKGNIVESLALAFEKGTIKIIPDETLIGELQAYEMERLPSGMMRYNAPAGMHDDCVMSLALAWSGASSPPAAGAIIDDLDMAIYRSKRTSIWD